MPKWTPNLGEPVSCLCRISSIGQTVVRWFQLKSAKTGPKPQKNARANFEPNLYPPGHEPGSLTAAPLGGVVAGLLAMKHLKAGCGIQTLQTDPTWRWGICFLFFSRLFLLAFFLGNRFCLLEVPCLFYYSRGKRSYIQNKIIWKLSPRNSQSWNHLDTVEQESTHTHTHRKKRGPTTTKHMKLPFEKYNVNIPN